MGEDVDDAKKTLKALAPVTPTCGGVKRPFGGDGGHGDDDDAACVKLSLDEPLPKRSKSTMLCKI